jgi:ABC-type multidrug transport system fused ATPase/permease subunit
MKVFISSPVRGYESIRKACREELEHLDLDYFISEYEGSYTLDSISVCLDGVSKCDIYILLLVNSYGFIIPNLNLSFTELEFDEAIKQNKPILVYKLEFFDYEERQNRFIKKVEDIHNGLFRGAIIKNSDELKQRLASDIINYLAYKQDLYPNESSISVKQKLKDRTHLSINKQFSLLSSKKIGVDEFYSNIYIQRDLEDWILRFVSQNEKSACAVIGRAGSGKSTLITKIALDLLKKGKMVIFYNTKYLIFDQNLVIVKHLKIDTNNQDAMASCGKLLV